MVANRALALLIGLLTALAVFLAAPPGTAQEVDAEPAPVTTADPAILLGHLKVLLRPLSLEELEVELDGWLTLLKVKITEVGATELKLVDLAALEEAEELPEEAADTEEPEAEPSETNAEPEPTTEELTAHLIVLRTEETALVERSGEVIQALEDKGGDGESATNFLDAISGLDTATDATSLLALARAQLSAWAKRDDGGKLWIKKGLAALFVLFVFWIISKFTGHAVERGFEKNPRISNLLANFARKTAGGLVTAVGLLMALATLGVPITPLLAAMGGGGFIIGFALQETLGNFASGMLIMVYRPFDLSDYVNVAGVEGTVKQLNLVSTTLVTLDNKLLVIPNKTVWGETITNYTGSDLRRVDMVFGIAYGDNIQKALDVLEQAAANHKLVLNDPAPAVHVDALGDSSVNLFCRPWVKTEDYWPVRWDLTRTVKERFDEEGISIPFPQQDVHYHPANTPV
jgi:small conductance mechanosensitive channel